MCPSNMGVESAKDPQPFKKGKSLSFPPGLEKEQQLGPLCTREVTTTSYLENAGKDRNKVAKVQGTSAFAPQGSVLLKGSKERAHPTCTVKNLSSPNQGQGPMRSCSKTLEHEATVKRMLNLCFDPDK